MLGLREFLLCSYPSSYSQCIVRLIDVVLQIAPTAVIALAYKNSLFHTVCNDFAAVTLVHRLTLSLTRISKRTYLTEQGEPAKQIETV